MLTDLRILVMLLLDTLPMLGNVLLLCFFVFFIFGIVGVQLWAGLLRQRCVLELPDNVSVAGYDDIQLIYQSVMLTRQFHPRQRPRHYQKICTMKQNARF